MVRLALTLIVVFVFLLPPAAVAEETFAERCAAAGGRYTGSACTCPNGSYLNPYFDRCDGEKNRPRELADLRAECREFLAEAAAPAVPLTFGRLHAFVRRRGIRSTAGLLRAFAHHPVWSPFLSSHVLMHTSQSSQRDAVDAAHPRMIFHGRDLLFALTAHPDHPRINNRLEVIEYDRSCRRYRFHELDFNYDPPRPDSAPTSCRNCHGVESRPIWPTYRIWPGAYTSLVTFRSRHPQSDIYSLLRPTRYGEDTAQLNTYLNRLNFARLEAALRETPGFRELRHALVGALIGCGNLDAFLPPAAGPHDPFFRPRPYAAIVADTERVLGERYRRIRELAVAIHDEGAAGERDENDFGDVPRIAGLRYLFETGGSSLANYSSNFEPGRATYGYGFNEFGGDGGGLRQMLCRFLPVLMEDDPALAPLADIRGYGYPASSEERRHCDLLRRRSRETLGR